MDAIRERIKNPIVTGIAGLVVGLIIGLLFAWGIWPVKYTDAAPQHLHPGFQDDFLRMGIDSFKVNQNKELARRRWMDLGDEAPTVLQKIKDAGDMSMQDIVNFEQAAQATTAAATEETIPGEEEKGRSPLATIFIVMCGVTLVLGVAFAAVYLLRSRSGAVTPAMQAQEAARQAQWTDYEAIGEEAPISQFMASYKLGDDLFDDSFSIDSPSGEFLGECGVGISETIGVGDPKKVTAFEVWLFDKNDIQTVTKVLMSEHAHQDNAIQQRLAAKGEPVLIELGSQTDLDTATLRLTARVVDLVYGEGALPEQSFFDSMILEIAVWQK